jgi:hypothetical protein
MLNALSSDTVVAEDDAVLLKHPEETRRMKKWLENHILNGKDKWHAIVVTVTPVLARLLLLKNPINRPYSRRGRNELQQDMEKGRFVFNGESIVISKIGNVLDGQHRLDSIVKTGVPIETVMVFGVEDEARFTIDTGRNKSVSNFLAMKGRDYTQVTGAAMGYWLMWKEHNTFDLSHNSAPSKAAILEACDKHPGIDDSAAFTYPCMQTVRGHAVLTFIHFALWKKFGRAEADEFLTKVIFGEDLHRGHPIWYCRNRLHKMDRTTRAHTKVELLFKVWNAYRNKQGVEHCKITGKFPKLV